MKRTAAFSRRDLLMLGMAAVPALARAQAPVSTPALGRSDLVDSWRTGFAGPIGRTFAWWYAGTLYAHVDGLREFPILALNAIMICKTSADADTTVVDWRTIGYFSDLESGEPAAHWDNMFTGRPQPVPPRFIEGPGQYRLAAPDATLSLTAANVRTNRATLTGGVTADGVMLTQIEATLQGLPGLDGTLPPLDGPGITERQTRLQLVIPHGGAASPSGPPREIRGFFNHVYDALPPWLGFGDRLGSVLSKGVMRKADADERVDAAVWSKLHRLYGAAFLNGRLRLFP